MSNEASINLISEWLMLKQVNVLDRFHSLERAYSDGYNDHRFVYIPGTRKDRALLVAHSDTVWGDKEISLVFNEKNGTLESTSKGATKTIDGVTSWHKGIGIGADDRAGCAILWQLRDLGHSVLVTSGEEQGCKTAKWMIEDSWWKKELNSHVFAVEFDRKNQKDIVFYDVGTNKFAKYVEKETGFKPDYGCGTDIKYICKDICGVNMSVGYFKEHQEDENINVEYWLNTLKTAKTWLSKDGLEVFKLEENDKFKMYSTYSYNGTDSWHGGSSCGYNGGVAEITDRFKCPICNEFVKYEFWFDAMLRCPKCGREV